jgi:hypothetical protein
MAYCHTKVMGYREKLTRRRIKRQIDASTLAKPENNVK